MAAIRPFPEAHSDQDAVSVLIGSRLLAARVRARLRQQDVQDRTSILAGVLSRYETNHLMVRADRLRALAIIYDVSADWLLGLTDDPSPRQAVSDLKRQGSPRERHPDNRISERKVITTCSAASRMASLQPRDVLPRPPAADLSYWPDRGGPLTG